MAEGSEAPKRPLSLKEAAEAYSVNYATLRRAVSEGRVKAERLGDLVWIVQPAEIERFIRQRNGRRRRKKERAAQ